MNNAARPEVFAMLSATVSVQTAQMLVEKGVISQNDMLEIYSRAVGNIADENDRVEAVMALQALIPTLMVSSDN